MSVIPGFPFGLHVAFSLGWCSGIIEHVTTGAMPGQVLPHLLKRIGSFEESHLAAPIILEGLPVRAPIGLKLIEIRNTAPGRTTLVITSIGI